VSKIILYENAFRGVDQSNGNQQQCGDDQQLDSPVKPIPGPKTTPRQPAETKADENQFSPAGTSSVPAHRKNIFTPSNALKMEDIEQETILVAGGSSTENEFRPTGAVAFFIVLILLSLATWFGIYLLMLQRV